MTTAEDPAMSLPRAALLGLGVCGLAAAATTLTNTVLPYFFEANGFEARTALIHNPFYAARTWVLLVHPFFTLMLALGLALALKDRAPGRAAASYSFAFVEKLVEFLLGFTILVVVNGAWKAGYLAGGPDAAALRAKVETFNQVIEAAYPLLWTMFILSTALYCTAMRRRGLEAWVAGTGAVTCLITALMFADEYAGQAWAEPIVQWTYPWTLTAHRLLAAIWLIRLARAV
ncbi:MAG TPA: hypothetical protein VEA44_19140 [Caulobacter sp.]|nr:hypothetical protein [Caulobacter sp.]